MRSKRENQAITYEEGKITQIYATYYVEHKGIETIWYINTDWYCPQPEENPYWKVDDENVEDKIVEHIKSKFRKFVKTFHNKNF
jgi:hypothetical protein